MQGIQDIDPKEIEKRKERFRRVWNYQPVDHIPMGFYLDDLSRYTLREQCANGKIQYEVNFNNIDFLLQAIPDDYIPAARVWPGYITIATMFGMEPHWSDEPNQSPGVTGKLVEKPSDIEKLEAPDPARAGLMPFNLEWLDYTRRNLPEEVLLTGIDLGGPMNTAKDLFETNLLYTMFYDAPELFHRFLDMATEVQIGCYREIIKAVGGIDNLTCIDFDPLWAPEGRKGFVSDDVCASFSPDIFTAFSRPYNSRIFQQWRGGRIHNCGPHPSIHEYLDHDPPINGVNCSFTYTRNDLPEVKKAFKRRGIIELMFDNGESAEEILAGMEEIAGALAPDVIGIPMIWLSEQWSRDEITQIWYDLEKICRSYAQSMNWRS